MSYTPGGYPYLEVSSIPLWVEGAWKLMQPEQFLGGPGVRGQSTLVPHAAGKVANPVTEDETLLRLSLIIQGIVIGNGGATTGVAFDRLLTNIADLRTNVYAQPTLPTVTRPAVFHQSASVSTSANVQVLGPMGLVFVSESLVTATFDLRVPVWFA